MWLFIAMIFHIERPVKLIGAAYITGARLYRRPVDVVVGIPSSVFRL
jgi:hypothetical protein